MQNGHNFCTFDIKEIETYSRDFDPFHCIYIYQPLRLGRM